MIGTRYHFNDTYRYVMDQEAAKPRIYAATEDATPNAPAVFMDEETLAERRKSSPYVFACQYLQNPVADDAQGFREDWLSYYDTDKFSARFMNRYILVDPAGERKIKNTRTDYTVIAVVGLGPDLNYYLIDAVRDRLNLTERTKEVFRLVRKHKPLNVGYEKYGLQADAEHIKEQQEHTNFRFRITELGGNQNKNDRIRKLVPLFENRRFFLPHRLLYKKHDGKTGDFVREFIDDEFTAFPVAIHDDMLDSLARILDTTLDAKFPSEPTNVHNTPRVQTNRNYKVFG